MPHIGGKRRKLQIAHGKEKNRKQNGIEKFAITTLAKEKKRCIMTTSRAALFSCYALTFSIAARNYSTALTFGAI